MRREHLLAFIPHARERAREIQRGHPGFGGEERQTAHHWLVNARCFFAEVCTWATEHDSPFQTFAPPAVPLERHDLRNQGFEQARRRQAKRQLATILDLEREVPGIRALATQRWRHASELADTTPGDRRTQAEEVDAFWGALIELLCQSGLRIEEACELSSTARANVGPFGQRARLDCERWRAVRAVRRRTRTGFASAARAVRRCR